MSASLLATLNQLFLESIPGGAAVRLPMWSSLAPSGRACSNAPSTNACVWGRAPHTSPAPEVGQRGRFCRTIQAFSSSTQALGTALRLLRLSLRGIPRPWTTTAFSYTDCPDYIAEAVMQARGGGQTPRPRFPWSSSSLVQLPTYFSGETLELWVDCIGPCVKSSCIMCYSVLHLQRNKKFKLSHKGQIRKPETNEVLLQHPPTTV